MEFILPLIYNPLLTWEMPKFHFFKKQWWSARAVTATKVRILHWQKHYPIHFTWLGLSSPHSVMPVINHFNNGSTLHPPSRPLWVLEPLLHAYRNILLVFPYGDTRWHGGLPLCWAGPLTIVGRVQPITYNNNNNNNNNRHNLLCLSDTGTERAGKRQRGCVCACEALKTKKAKINMTRLQKHSI